MDSAWSLAQDELKLLLGEKTAGYATFGFAD